jgi:hypothetical protein
MLTLPDEYNTLFAQLRSCFSKRVWKLAMVLLIGAILAPGKRTVTGVTPFQWTHGGLGSWGTKLNSFVPVW